MTTDFAPRFSSVDEMVGDARSRLRRLTAHEVRASAGQRWVVICAEGYTSSLAADALLSLGVPAIDLIDGFQAWRAEGLPIVPGTTGPNRIVRG